MDDAEHRPVLRDAAVSALAIRPGGTYIDATFGRGGHARAILGALGPAGRLIVLDQDPDAAAHARALAADEPRLRFVRTSFTALTGSPAVAEAGSVDGVLFDLGVSSPQFDVAERGFSFRHAGPLDMRMNPEAGRPLRDWLMQADRGEIARVIRTLGEEPLAGRIASAIVAAREAGTLTDTAALASTVRAAVPARVAAGKRTHPATRTFQALRMHVNDELGALDAGLAGALSALAPGGRLVVISFHSLEDRRVKRFMRHQAQPPQPALPMAPRVEAALRLIGKPVKADAGEVAANPRARSAIMRTAERTQAARVPT